MAYINGNEVLFSANVDISEGGGLRAYTNKDIYNKGDIVSYNGLLYTPKTDMTSGVLPTVKDSWEELTSGKVDKIINTSSSRFVYMADREGETNDKIILGAGSGANGVQMPSNGLMLAQYNGGGKLCTNDPTQDYHVVNLKTLNEKIAQNSGGGNSSSKWDFSMSDYLDWETGDYNWEIGITTLNIEFDIEEGGCAMIEMVIHNEQDGIHKCGYYILEFYNQNGSACVPMIASPNLPINAEPEADFSNHFKITCEASTGGGTASSPMSSVQIRVLSGTLSNVNVYLTQ